MRKSITPVIVGSGQAGFALGKAWAALSVLHPDWHIQSPIWAKRGSPLRGLRRTLEGSIVCVANPHGLHAETLIEAAQAEFDAALCEKPACVTLAEVRALRGLRMPTAVLHVYRQMWGIQEIRRMVMEGFFGTIVAVEGRYWQASAAARALEPDRVGAVGKGWKDDPRMSGEFDAYLDMGTHWLDAASFLVGANPSRILGWRSYANASSLHRDTHVQLAVEFPSCRAVASISKAWHGAGNHFEIQVLGTARTARWVFSRPDEVEIGEGNSRRVAVRQELSSGSRQPAYHGMGWIEGYMDTISRVVDEVYFNGTGGYPSLGENLALLESIFATNWAK